MAIQKINIGNIVNDGLGDDLRTAFTKVNENFGFFEEQIDIALQRDAENVGGGAPVFKQKVDNILQFRTLLSGRYTAVEEIGDGVQINSTVPQPWTRIDTNQGSVFSDTSPELTLQGAGDVTVTANGSTITINSISSTASELSNFDFGPIDGEYTAATQLSLAAANIDFGTVDYPGNFEVDLGTAI